MTMTRMLLLGLFAPLVVAAPALAESPFDGTWKIDLGASKLPEKPDVFLLKDGVYECRSCAPAFKVKADGAFHPVAGHPYYDAVSIKVVDPRTVVETDRKGAKTVVSSTNSVSADGRTVYASWNGATAVADWRVLAGPSASALKPVASAPRSGFETAISTAQHGAVVEVQALDQAGHVLGSSAPVDG